MDVRKAFCLLVRCFDRNHLILNGSCSTGGFMDSLWLLRPILSMGWRLDIRIQPHEFDGQSRYHGIVTR